MAKTRIQIKRTPAFETTFIAKFSGVSANGEGYVFETYPVYQNEKSCKIWMNVDQNTTISLTSEDIGKTFNLKIAIRCNWRSATVSSVKLLEVMDHIEDEKDFISSISHDASFETLEVDDNGRAVLTADGLYVRASAETALSCKETKHLCFRFTRTSYIYNKSLVSEKYAVFQESDDETGLYTYYTILAA